jgi:hypothetical protein
LDLIDTNLVKKLETWLQKEFKGFDILVKIDDEKSTSCDQSSIHHILQKRYCKK